MSFAHSNNDPSEAVPLGGGVAIKVAFHDGNLGFSKNKIRELIWGSQEEGGIILESYFCSA